jgi:hypothetical protein
MDETLRRKESEIRVAIDIPQLFEKQPQARDDHDKTPRTLSSA